MKNYTNQLIRGDSLKVLPKLPADSVDLVFADPPYNLQLKQELWRPDHSQVDAVSEEWDQFDSFKAYDIFTETWLKAIQGVMKPTATIWVSGTYHNIFRVGTIMQNLGFWILNTIAWMKFNAMPNFRGTRLKNDVEFIIWAKYDETSRYTFNHHLMKQFNDFGIGKQLGSVWKINKCVGPERMRDENGEKLHPTQKPEELLRRIILASSKPNDIVLDPFSGTGTTPAMAKHLRRQYIAIEQDNMYHNAALQRVANIKPLSQSDAIIKAVHDEKPPRVAFKKLLKADYIQVGQKLYLDEPAVEAIVTQNAKLQANNQVGSIHSLACALKKVRSTNGWVHWYYLDETGTLQQIDKLRQQYRQNGL